MNKQNEAMKQALEALQRCVSTCFDQCSHEQVMSRPEHFVNQAIKDLKDALVEQPAQEPVAWNVIDPLGKVVATETNAVRGWARIDGYKPTVEGLLGFHEQGWRVVPATPQPPAKP